MRKMRTCKQCNVTSSYTRASDLLCVKCQRKNNPEIVERIKQHRKLVGPQLADRWGKGKHEAKTRKIRWALTKEEFENLNSKPCFYCRGALPPYGVGLDRLSNDKKVGYCIENVVPCCTICNSIRGDKLTVSEMLSVSQALRDHKSQTLQVLHQEHYNLDTRTIFIFGDIDENMSRAVHTALESLENINNHSNITVHIMSDGGNWHDGLAIYDRFKNSKCPITMIGTGLVASTATVIFQAGTMRKVTQNCTFMLHDGSESFDGEAKSFEAWADASKKSRKLMYSIYAERSKKSAEYWQILCQKDAIFSAKELIELGLADEIL